MYLQLNQCLLEIGRVCLMQYCSHIEFPSVQCHVSKTHNNKWNRNTRLAVPYIDQWFIIAKEMFTIRCNDIKSYTGITKA